MNNLTFIEDVIFVIWDWKWIKEDSDSGSDTSAASILVPAFDSEDDSNSDDAPDSSEVTHSVTFKCIGSTKEQRYQEFLARIAQKRSKGEDVQCKIKPEPTNPVDSQAIAFESEIDGVWQVIGYVVKEALCDVHNALAAKKVISVSFDWVKYQLYWLAPGWYAGINITRLGKWSSTVLHSHSSKVH